MTTPKLTAERLFAEPPLFRPAPSALQFAPDGSYLAMLRPAADDHERMDLWRYDIGTRKLDRWVDARNLGATGPLSDAEKAERERRRQFSHGVSRFAISADGCWVLIGAGGAGFLLDTTSSELRQVTPAEGRHTELTFAPDSRQLSYVRAGNLYRYDIAAGAETAVTTNATPTVSYGAADFLAAEEMHRFAGHWWSPDATLLAYTRVDESPVALSRRFEIGATGFDVVEQRYPYTGAANPEVELWVADLESDTAHCVRFTDNPDDYLARVDWVGSRVAVQSQSRSQRILNLDLIDPRTGSNERLLQEHSDTWINLHDNFRATDSGRIFWTSERDGCSQLYVYDGAQASQLTRDRGRVGKLLRTTEDHVDYLGWTDTPTEQHLYRLDLATGKRSPLTHEAGWHDGVVSADGHWFADRWSTLSSPGQLEVLDLVKATSHVVIDDGIDSDHPYRPYLPAHCESVLGTLNAADGQQLHYRLTRPQGAGPHPVIVSVYGGPGVQRVRNEWPPSSVALFSQHGFAVMELDNRGSANREKAFADPIFGRLGSVEVADQVAACQWLQGLDWVDSQRIGVFGHSYGGYMALMCLCMAPDIFRAGVAVAPVTDWTLYDTHYTERYLGTPQDNPSGYVDSAVFPHLQNLRGALLVIHGMADDNVLFTHSTKLFAALQQANQRFEMMTYPGAKHALQERDVAIHRFSLILEFFERAL